MIGAGWAHLISCSWLDVFPDHRQYKIAHRLPGDSPLVKIVFDLQQVCLCVCVGFIGGLCLWGLRAMGRYMAGAVEGVYP